MNDREKLEAMVREKSNPWQEKATDQCCNAAREQTVAEFLDQRIREATSVANALRDLKDSLPGYFLNSGASRIAALSGR